LVNNSLNQINLIINKVYDDILALDNTYQVQTYSPEVVLERGKYSFNIIPQQVVPRITSASRDLDNLVIDVFMHYDMEADDEFKPSWGIFMTKANAVVIALFNKANFVNGVSDVDIGVDFGNSVIEKERVISLTFKCEYKIFASR